MKREKEMERERDWRVERVILGLHIAVGAWGCQCLCNYLTDSWIIDVSIIQLTALIFKDR